MNTGGVSGNRRLVVLASHPVQYLGPWFRHLSERMWVKVFYMHRQSSRDQARAGYGHPFNWDVPVMDGYALEWLPNVARRPGVDRFGGCDTPDVERFLVRENADAVLAFGWKHKSSWQTFRACKRLGIPMLMRGDSTLRYNPSPLRRVVRGLTHGRFLPRFDAHLYVGERNRRYLRHYGVPDERLFFTPHAVDNDRFRCAAKRAVSAGECARLRHRLGISPTGFVYLCASRLTPIKHCGDLLEAFELLERLRPEMDAHVVIIGDGPMRGSLARLASGARDRVHFVGFQNQSVLPAWYAMADALVVSGRETWGMVVNEAAACGLATVASDEVGCVEDMIEPGESGLVFRCGDVRDLADKLAAIRDLVLARPRAVAASLERKCIDYSYEAATTGLMRALDWLLAEGTPMHGRTAAEHLG